MKWLDNILRKRSTKRFIKNFIANPYDSVVLKQWEHRTWGDSIHVSCIGLFGHLSGLRLNAFCCDLQDGDVIVFKSSDSTQSNGKKYDIGLVWGVEVMCDPPDMFFAKYLRIGFADDYSIETIVELAKTRIKKI